MNLTRGERLQIMLTPEEIEALDDWRFKRRMPSRAAAVRELLRRGLAAEGFSLAPTGQKSGDFGVTDKPPEQPAPPNAPCDWRPEARRASAKRRKVEQTVTAAARPARQLPETFETPPRRRRWSTGISISCNPAAAARICISRFQP